jgi:protein-disulfide isomerase
MSSLPLTRRAVLAVAASAATLVTFASPALAAIDIDGILHDPETPTGGNPQGDVTIVAFTDYNCPFCKKSEPDLQKIVKDDGKIRLVYKDWPILAASSVYGARMALAARYQNAYERAHDALMAIPGPHIPADKMTAAIAAAGLDMTKLTADLEAHGDAITNILKRTMAQADSLSLQGTPTYLIGPFRAGTLDYAGFKTAIADARIRQAVK